MIPVYTCIACRVVFADQLTQRAHYKADWHRYNLKRKVADLPPVNAENFKQRVLNAQQSQVEAEEKPSLTCSLCGKHFSSQNAHQDHLRSKKHRENEAKAAKKNKNTKDEEPTASGSGTITAKGPQQSSKKLAGASGDADMGDIETDSDVESVDSFGDADGLGLEECLFCSNKNDSLEGNVKHMTEKHSFFLPDAEYIVDLEGLITYLGQKVGAGNMCLWCNEKGRRFHSAQAVQKHMLDKGHCKILHEGDVLLEYADYYDYRSSYPDYDENAEGGGADGEEEMETDVTPDTLAAEGFELILPSGASVGHRSLQRYYKQNINPRSIERGHSALPKMLAQYKALGWTGATGPVAQKRCKDLAAIQRLKSKSYMRIGQKANKFQPHLRPQVVF